MSGRVPAALRSRLGDDGTFSFIEFMDAHREEVVAAATSRYEARLTAEMAALRRDVAQELATTRTEMLRCAFVFWIGQVAAISALVVFGH